MAYALKYTTTRKDRTGNNQYLIEIFEDDFGGSDQEIRLQVPEPFTVQVGALGNSNLYNPFGTSICTLNILTDISSLVEETYVASDTQFRVDITRQSDSVLIFTGYISADFLNSGHLGSNQHNVQLVATDLSLLNNLYFTQDGTRTGTVWTGKQTASMIIKQCLALLNLDLGFKFDGIDWYPASTNVTASDNPLDHTSVDQLVYRNISPDAVAERTANANNPAEAMKALDVLRDVLTRFKLYLVQREGNWEIVNTDAHRTGSRKVWTYDSNLSASATSDTGSFLNVDNVGVLRTDFHPRFVQPVEEITIEYLHDKALPDAITNPRFEQGWEQDGTRRFTLDNKDSKEFANNWTATASAPTVEIFGPWYESTGPGGGSDSGVIRGYQIRATTGSVGLTRLEYDPIKNVNVNNSGQWYAHLTSSDLGYVFQVREDILNAQESDKFKITFHAKSEPHTLALDPNGGTPQEEDALRSNPIPVSLRVGTDWMQTGSYAWAPTESLHYLWLPNDKNIYTLELFTSGGLPSSQGDLELRVYQPLDVWGGSHTEDITVNRTIHSAYIGNFNLIFNPDQGGDGSITRISARNTDVENGQQFTYQLRTGTGPTAIHRSTLVTGSDGFNVADNYAIGAHTTATGKDITEFQIEHMLKQWALPVRHHMAKYIVTNDRYIGPTDAIVDSLYDTGSRFFPSYYKADLVNQIYEIEGMKLQSSSLSLVYTSQSLGGSGYGSFGSTANNPLANALTRVNRLYMPLTVYGDEGAEFLAYHSGSDTLARGNITITGSAGQLWQLVDVNSGSVFEVFGRDSYQDFLVYSDTDDHRTYVGGKLFVSESLSVTGSSWLANVTASNISASAVAVDYIDFKVSQSAVVHNEGRVHWNEDDKTLYLDTNVVGTSVRVGQHVLFRAVNKTGATIDHGEVVFVDSSQGNTPTIRLAISSIVDNEQALQFPIGVVLNGIDNNKAGFVTKFGFVKDLDTLEFDPGQSLWISHLVSGSFTGSIPPIPFARHKIGVVLNDHATEGSILVDIDTMPLSASYTVTASFSEFAMTASFALNAGSGGSGSSLWTENGDDIYFNTGNVGIGLTNPTASLHIHSFDSSIPLIVQSGSDSVYDPFIIVSSGSERVIEFNTPAGTVFPFAGRREDMDGVTGKIRGRGVGTDIWGRATLGLDDSAGSGSQFMKSGGGLPLAALYISDRFPGIMQNLVRRGLNQGGAAAGTQEVWFENNVTQSRVIWVGVLGSTNPNSIPTLTRWGLNVDPHTASPWNNTDFCITAAGNVGIGIDSPTTELHVNGEVSASAYLNSEYIQTIWAEEAAALNAGVSEFSFGNGAENSRGVPIYVPSNQSCEVIAMGVNAPNGTPRVQLRINQTNQPGWNVLVSSAGVPEITEFTSSFALANGDMLTFNTIATGGNTTGPNVVTAYLRYRRIS
jgi:hypothetical protein